MLRSVLATLLVVLAILALPSTAAPAAEPSPIRLSFTFESGAEGWAGGFADHPDGPLDVYELSWGHAPLPVPYSGAGMRITGHNRSDDLFMYLKRRLDGLTPGQHYKVSFRVDLLSNGGAGCFGVGGAPGDGVYMKAGAASVEPLPVIVGQSWRMNIDHGAQSNSGAQAKVIGSAAVPGLSCSADQLGRKIVDGSSAPVIVRADAEGGIWLIVASDSAFEGKSTFYYDRIEVQAVPTQPVNIYLPLLARH